MSGAKNQYGRDEHVIPDSSLLQSSRDTRIQIVEFAVAIPLLVVFVVGIFDFRKRLQLETQNHQCRTHGSAICLD